MKNTCLASILVFSLAWAGCGGSDGGGGGSGGMAGMGGMGGAAGAAGAGGAPGTGGSGGAAGAGGGSGNAEAPIITAVTPMQGALHVAWTNVTPNCDKIELDRNKDGGAYATAYTLVGVATSQHDTSATAPGTYCYKARCIKGAMTSPDSNEKCGTP